MVRFETSIKVLATPGEIWQVLSRVLDWQIWTPTIESIHALDGPTLAVGHRFEVRQPKLRPTVWIVKSVISNEEFTWTMSQLGVIAIATHKVTALQGGTSSVTLSVSFRGFLAPLVWLIAGSTTREYVRTEKQDH